MKKLTALVLSLFIVFAFVACDKKEESKKAPAHTVDVEYYAKNGQIPEHKYHLGSSPDDMKEDFEAENEANEETLEDEHSHDVYSFIEEDDYNILVYESANYYYKEDEKISAIVSFDNSYDFNIGDLPKQITTAIGECDIMDGDAEKIFFLPLSQNFTYLEYTFGENNLIFVFEENGLCATALISQSFYD